MSNHDPDAILDPRAGRGRGQLALAPRLDRGALSTARVLLFDNTKLDFCHYGEIFTALERAFRDAGVKNIVRHRETVRGRDSAGLEELAGRLAEYAPKAVVLALSDMGVAPATVVLAAALERRGIPTVTLTAPPGTDLARAVAFYRAGRLCLIDFPDLNQATPAEAVARQTEAVVPAVLESLWGDEAAVTARAALDFALDRDLDAGPHPLAPASASAPGMNALLDCLEDLQLGDGLPVVPPTAARLAALLAWSPKPADTVLARELGPTGADVTVRDVAMAAVMAGCRPQYMPILVTAVTALAEGPYNLLQSVTTAHPGGNLLLVSGPLAAQVGLSGGPGCLGPGYRANATMGRALTLTFTLACRTVPGISDLAGLSSPAEFSFCFAEDRALARWETLAEEHGGDGCTVVYVLKAEGPHDITDMLSQDAESLLTTIVDSCTTLGSNNAYLPGSLLLVLSPDHADILKRDGWTKAALRRRIHEAARVPRSLTAGRGIVPVRPSEMDALDPMPITRSPDDVTLVVAGARGSHSAVVRPWALHSAAVVAPVLDRAGAPALSLAAFDPAA